MHAEPPIFESWLISNMRRDKMRDGALYFVPAQGTGQAFICVDVPAGAAVDFASDEGIRGVALGSNLAIVVCGKYATVHKTMNVRATLVLSKVSPLTISLEPSELAERYDCCNCQLANRTGSRLCRGPAI